VRRLPVPALGKLRRAHLDLEDATKHGAATRDRNNPPVVVVDGPYGANGIRPLTAGAADDFDENHMSEKRHLVDVPVRSE
jgi:hypothetical protein